MKFTVEKGKSYEAKIRLTSFEVMATNYDIGKGLNDIGFRQVEVTGKDDIRVASGTWTHDTRTVDLPSQVAHIEEVNIVYTDDPKKKSA